MNDLWAIIAELGLELHPDRIAVVAAKIDKLASVEQFALLKSSFGPNADKELINRFHQAWSNSNNVAPHDVASALQGASATAALSENRGAVEMVWTGPSTGQVPVRHTEQVLCEVINHAKRRLFLVSFVAYNVGSIISALRDAIGRQVQISILLEPSKEQGGKISNHDSAMAIKNCLPSIAVYFWTSKKSTHEERWQYGAVHAKCAVADEELAFITSANLTAAAMEKNMELGVLVRGGNLPVELHQHLEALIDTKIIEQV